MNQPGSKADADAATAQSAADRLAKIRPSESYADSVYDAYGSLPKGQLWRDLDALIAAARAGVPDWHDLEADITDEISDSLDMDWTARIGAVAVVAYLKKIGVRIPPANTTETT